MQPYIYRPGKLHLEGSGPFQGISTLDRSSSSSFSYSTRESRTTTARLRLAEDEDEHEELEIGAGELNGLPGHLVSSKKKTPAAAPPSGPRG
jgi:hypothetical protein